jgi:hypothetical protein
VAIPAALDEIGLRGRLGDQVPLRELVHGPREAISRMTCTTASPGPRYRKPVPAAAGMRVDGHQGAVNDRERGSGW